MSRHSSRIVPAPISCNIHVRAAISWLTRRESGGLDLDGRYTSRYVFRVRASSHPAPPMITLAMPLDNTKCTITPNDAACAHASGSNHAHEM